MSTTASKALRTTKHGWTFRHATGASMVAVYPEGTKGEAADVYDMYAIPEWVTVTHMNDDALNAVADVWLANHAPARPGPRPDAVDGAPVLVIGMNRIVGRPQRQVEYKAGEPIASPLMPGLVVEFLAARTMVVRCQGDVFPVIRPTASNTFEVFTENLLDVAKRQEARA
jgi:hypothetical protein